LNNAIFYQGDSNVLLLAPEGKKLIFNLHIISKTEIMETKEEKQLKLDKRYIRMASIWAENSYCERRQVGALIVKDKMIISDGYNGTPAGFENVCEDDNGVTKPYVLHAEANAITKIARSNNSSDGATMYVTASPCIECAKLIIQAGIKRVVYSEKYRLEDGLDLLKRANIEVIYINPNE
jgi:dCMP deaminase